VTTSGTSFVPETRSTQMVQR